METQTKTETIRMNLVMTYPVRWTEHSIISNYIQNFYDALGMENFAAGFHYRVLEEGTVLEMEAARGFAKEWLCYIGASTKRKENRTAGGFGEGFKIASLIAYRDYHLDITMQSRDWTLHVTSTEGKIAGEACAFLAYEIGERPYEDNAVLRLEHVTPEFLASVEDVMSDYYYPQNRRFGRCLAKGKAYAVYEAALSEEDVKKGRTRASGGALFASYQRRACLGAPIIICSHTYHPDTDDRDRDDLSAGQRMECIRRVTEELSPGEAWEILRYLRPYWGGTFKRRLEEPDWSAVITDLVGVVCSGERKQLHDTKRSTPSPLSQFRSTYADTLIVRDTEKLCPDKNRRSMAMAWFRLSPYRGRRSFVLPAFHEAGVMTVSELCAQNDGYTGERDPAGKELAYIRILRSAAEEVLKGVLVLDEKNWPECRILLNAKAPVAGYTKLVQTKGGTNSCGMQVRASARYVYLEYWHFRPDGFPEAFVTYCHELLHQFGGDSTIQFHRALELLNERILEQLLETGRYEAAWRRIGEDGTGEKQQGTAQKPGEAPEKVASFPETVLPGGGSE